MKKQHCKRLLAGVLSSAVFASATICTSAAITDKQPVKAVIASEISNTYQYYLDGKVTEDEHAGSKIAKYSVKSTASKSASNLPSSYKSPTTDIRDQGSYGTCWAFSAMANMETFLLKNGKGSLDFSESHLAWWSTSEYNSDGYGWQMDSIDHGGYSVTGMGYLISWDGVKNEADVPYDEVYQMPSNMDTAKTKYNATKIVYVGNDIDSVKNAIYNYGAVSTSYNSGDYYNASETAYYQPDETYYFNGHAITIVGWDDNYSLANFKAGCQPPADGAWLIKNSWGPELCDNGYLWISYYDRYLLDPQTFGASYSVTQARTARDYDTLYQNEEYGATYTTALYDETTANYASSATFANVFDFDSSDGRIEKVIFENQVIGSSYTVYYIPVKNNAPVSDRSQWVWLADGVVDDTGYICADTKPYYFPDGKGAIGISIDAGNTSEEMAALGVAEWLTDTNSNMIFKADAQRNESFIISDDGNVYDLMDVYENQFGDLEGGTLVIKALASTNFIGDIDLNNYITVSDACSALKANMNMISLNDEQFINADVNFDGNLRLDDAISIQKYAVGLISDF